mmetsp:Transcript_19398/g.48549  ORF Transcript_19398/g.48549 Transcript_19398/m.48549 type:complete len:246 (-) Transcript_19398:457-1194(-)
MVGFRAVVVGTLHAHMQLQHHRSSRERKFRDVVPRDVVQTSNLLTHASFDASVGFRAVQHCVDSRVHICHVHGCAAALVRELHFHLQHLPHRWSVHSYFGGGHQRRHQGRRPPQEAELVRIPLGKFKLGVPCHAADFLRAEAIGAVHDHARGERSFRCGGSRTGRTGLRTRFGRGWQIMHRSFRKRSYAGTRRLFEVATQCRGWLLQRAKNFRSKVSTRRGSGIGFHNRDQIVREMRATRRGRRR